MTHQVDDGNAVDILKAEIKGLRDELQSVVETKAVEASKELREQVQAMEEKLASLEEKQKEAEAYYTPGAELSKGGEKGAFSYARLLKGIALERKGAAAWGSKELGYEGEYLAEMQKKVESGVIKTYNTATDAAGGYLVGTDMQAGILEFLRPMSVAYSAGARRMDGLTQNIGWRKGEGGTTHYWVDSEASEAITKSQSTFSTITARPHPMGVLSELTWGMLNQPAEAVEMFVRQEMAAEAALGEDSAAFTGSGSNSEPLGILNTGGILQSSLGAGAGTTFGLTTPTAATALAALKYFRTFAQKMRAANSYGRPGASMAWVAENAVCEDIESVVDADGHTMFMSDDQAVAERLLRVPLYCNTQTAFAGTSSDRTLLMGDFSRVVIPHWGAMSFDVTNAHSDNFAKGIVTVRLMTALDVAVLEPKAFVEATAYAD